MLFGGGGCKWETQGNTRDYRRSCFFYNVFMRCHRRQQEKRITATCVLQSQSILSCHSNRRSSDEMLARPMRGYFSLPPHPPSTPSWGVQSGSQFTQGEQARQQRDKLFGLNKAFIKAGPPPVTCPPFGVISWPWPVCCPGDTSLTFIHHGWQVPDTARDVLVKCKNPRRQNRQVDAR